MLDTETKRRIDSARDILVGKVPDPKSQVEQITIALIYKFMDDMDAEAEELGGKSKFFAGDFAKYRWPQLIRAGFGGHETLNLYVEAITRMPENTGIPPLFRNIFNNAYLPYRDPETLRAFLKIIDEFTYDHSERLGDAFEYLLSVLGAQGDAGQFRTPRHIIDFIVEIIAPRKDETILDPACGTAGFLISAYKHICAANTDPDGNNTLTPDQRTCLADNLSGYDISPDMVRLSRVNMYLHKLNDPHIHEYDTLTSEERWDDSADVILANPPFMSPRGGIRPHDRFSVQSKRSEVLFVDYIAEHLNPCGRAGVIVPEGIIFQSQNAYKQLRKMLVENYLVAIISLPAGVFNPYSGVKTSILIMDKALARRRQHIAFFKVANDGYDLGAQRRPINCNDLPQVLQAVKEYLNQEPPPSDQQSLIQLASKAEIADNDDYNLSSNRYRKSVMRQSKFPLVKLGEVCDVFNGITSRRSEYNDSGTIKIIKVRDFTETQVFFDKDNNGWISKEIITNKYLQIGDTIMINSAHNASHVASKIGFIRNRPPFKSLPSGEVTVFRAQERISPVFLNAILKSRTIRQSLKEIVKGIHIYPKNIIEIEIPLPPLEVQQEIAAEVDAYEKVIDGVRAVLTHYRPRIVIDPDWPLMKLGEVVKLINGRAYKRSELLTKGPTLVLRVGNFFSNCNWYYSDLKLPDEKYCNEGDLLYAWSASFGPMIWTGPRAIFHYHIWKIETSDKIEKKFLYYLLAEDSERIKSEGSGIAMIHATKNGMEKRRFSLPSLEIQKTIIAELEREQKIINANHPLIERMESKIQDILAHLWD